VALLVWPLLACTTDPPSEIARHGGLQPEIVRGTDYVHQTYWRRDRVGSSPLYLFIDGDGIPWSSDSMRPSPDPTPRHPLALRLAAATPGTVAYLGRPCQFLRSADPACNEAVWTGGRYSPAVVDSMTAAANRTIQTLAARRVVLVGYSGGGVLAMLMAPRLESLVEIVTIAANLDVSAWVAWHHYEPLDGSLDPAQTEPLPRSIPQRHLVGARDSNVPPALNRAYWEQLPADRIWTYPDFDHVCCWAEQWPQILARLQADIDN
jgi:pimeloyl-ACP methyl ester carboxylesterase